MIRSIAIACCALVASNAFAGDLWEITSSSQAPDGQNIPFTQTKCLTNNAMSLSAVLNGLGDCSFDQKSGTETAMTFSMSCKIPGLPADTPSMKVTGDATMGANALDMRYIITAGAGFKMTVAAKARKVGACTGP